MHATPARTSSSPEIRIRPAEPGDTAAIAGMANALNLQHGKPGDLYDSALIDREAFGPAPLCSFLVALADGQPVGYALFHPMFNSDSARRGIWLTDLYVDPGFRGTGIGARLLAAVARHTVDNGMESLWWGVTSDNGAARRFYAQLGARDEDARILELDGTALADLASRERTQ